MFERIFFTSQMIDGLMLPVIKERQNKQSMKWLYKVVELSFVSSLMQTTKE